MNTFQPIFSLLLRTRLRVLRPKCRIYFRVANSDSMDDMRKKFGDRAVMKAAGIDARSIGRGENPFDGGPPVLLANRRQ